MDSLDAQSLIVAMIEPQMPAPDLWHHHRSGDLSCAYSRGTQTFTWGADAVGDMARQWRESMRSSEGGHPRPATESHPETN